MISSLIYSGYTKIRVFALLIIALLFVMSTAITANASLVSEYSYRGIKVSIYNAAEYYYIVVEYYPQVIFKWKTITGTIYTLFRSVKVVFVYNAYTNDLREYFHVFGNGYVLTRSINKIERYLFKCSNPIYILMDKNTNLPNKIAEEMKNTAIRLLENKFHIKIPDSEIWVSSIVYKATRDLSRVAYRSVYNIISWYDYWDAYTAIKHTIYYYYLMHNNFEYSLNYNPYYIAKNLAESIYNEIYK